MPESDGIELFRIFGDVFLKGGEAVNKQLETINKNAESAGGEFEDLEKSFADTWKELDNLEEKVDKAEKSNNFGKIVGGIAKGALVIGTAAIAAGTAVFGMAVKTGESSSRINDLSQKMGISKTGFQEWDYIMQQTGSSVESLQGAIKTLSDAAYDSASGSNKKAAAAFKELGIEVQNTNGTFKDQETLFGEVITALAGMDDHTKRTALATDLLGRSATELSPLLNEGAAGIAKMREEAHSLGLIISDEAIISADEFGDSLDKLKATVGSLFIKALTPLMPALTELIDKFVEILPPLMKFIAPLAEKLVPVIETIIDKLLPVFLQLLDDLSPILDPLIDMFLLLVDSVLVPLIEQLTPIVIELLPPLIDLFKQLLPVVKPLLELLVKLLDLVLPPTIALIKWLLDTFIPPLIVEIDKFAVKVQATADAIKKVVDWVTTALEKMGLYNKTELNDKRSTVTTVYRDEYEMTFGGGGRGFASGTDYVPESGRYIVGERGPEEVFLPQGAAVKPNVSNAPVINIYNPKIFNQNDARELGNLIYQRWLLLGAARS